MGKCESCGAEDVTTQWIQVGYRGLYVCGRCYAEIERNKAEKGKNTMTKSADAITKRKKRGRLGNSAFSFCVFTNKISNVVRFRR